MSDKAFSLTSIPEIEHEGFHMTFKNGCTISVQFGKHNYCDEGKTTAEVAAWNKKGDWMLFDWKEKDWTLIPDGSEVMSRCSPEEVAMYMETLSTFID